MLNLDVLSSLFASLNVGEPTNFKGWKLFPLFPTVAPAVSLITVRTAVESGLARVGELPQGAHHRALHLRNRGSLPMLVREGDLFVAGLQDRVADRPMLVAAGSCAELPVSCVEQNRWSLRDRPDLAVCADSADITLRHRRMSDSASVKRPDQHATWEAVAERRRARGLTGEGGSMVEAQVQPRVELDSAVDALAPIYGAAGLVLCHETPRGPRVALVEWFADPSACADAWTGIVRGVMANLPQGARPPRLSRTELRAFFAALIRAPRWVAEEDSSGTVLGITYGRTRARALVHESHAIHLAAVHA